MAKCIVLKVSGHLAKMPNELRNLISAAESIQVSNPIFVVVPGGSIFADAVQELQKIARFNDDVAHWMAVKAMEVYAVLIAKYSRLAVETETLDDINKALESHKLPVVMPYKILREYDELPHSWEVTSDSISILIAHKLKCEAVCLSKLVDGLTDERGRVIDVIEAEKLRDMKQNVVDTYLPHAIERYRIRVIIFNALKPWILKKIVSGERDSYTVIVP